MKKILLFFVLFGFTTNLFAQFNLQGKIEDEASGEALPFVNVVLKSNKKGTATNVDGYFTLFDVPTDTSTILISYLGYGISEVKLTPQDFKGQRVFEIKKQAIELKTFEISDQSKQTIKLTEDVSRVSLNPAQLQNLPNLGEVDIFRGLQLLPGVSGTSESSSGLYVRGGTPDQNLVLLDGINIYHVDHFFGIFSPFNAYAIKDVQFYKGGFPAEFGGRLSSVVDLTAKTGNAKKPSLAFNGNMLSLNGVIESPLPKKLGSILIAGRRSYTDFIQSPTYNNLFDNVSEQDQEDLGFGIGGFNQVEPDFFFYDLNAKVTLTPTDVDVISFNFFSSKDNLDNSSEDSFGGFGKLETIDKTNWGNDGYSLKWSRQFNPKFYSKAILSYSKYQSDYELGNNFYSTDSLGNDSLLFSFNTVQNNTVEDVTFRYDAEFQYNPNHTLKFGTWITNNQIKYLNVLDDSINLQDRKEAGTTYSFFVQNRSEFGKLTTEGGLRGSYFTPTSKIYFEPRLSFNYNLFKNVRVKGAWGVYRQFINRVILENVFGGSRDFWLLSDGNTLPVSFAQHYILGAAYENNSWLFDVEAYRKNTGGLLEYSLRFGGFDDSNENFDNLFFRGTGVVHGIDFLLQRKMGAFTGWIGYTLSKVDYTFPKINQGRTFPALHDQRHEAKIIGSYTLGDFVFASTFIYATGKPYTAPIGQYNIKLIDDTERQYIHFGDKNSQRLPDYHRLDFSITYNYEFSFMEGNAGISFFNLYNRQNIKYKRFFLREFDPETFMPIPPELVETDITLLGFVPNFFISFRF